MDLSSLELECDVRSLPHRCRALRVPQEKVFHEVFTPVELSPVDFVRLVDLAERRVIRKGSLLSKAGVTQEEVFLMVEGTAEASISGVCQPHHVFLRFGGKPKEAFVRVIRF